MRTQGQPGKRVVAALGMLAAANGVAHAAPVDASLDALLNAPAGMKLVWADEFNTDGAPDPQKWSFENGFVRNEEAQWYQPDNARIQNGMLVITARRERKPNPNYKANSTDWRTNRPFIEYTSSSLITGPKGGAWQYGRFEMRARIDTRLGIWPAFWTVGQNGEWPGGGEIDIMEFYRGKLLANFAWGTDRRWNAKWNSSAKPITEFNDPNWSKQFHIWSMDWDENTITLSVDGQVLNRQDVNQTVNGDAEAKNPFRAPQTIILNSAIGGQNGGDPSATPFPSLFEVDYVRVYQPK
jgi:beta-glucanase (GH16 family)